MGFSLSSTPPHRTLSNAIQNDSYSTKPGVAEKTQERKAPWTFWIPLRGRSRLSMPSSTSTKPTLPSQGDQIPKIPRIQETLGVFGLHQLWPDMVLRCFFFLSVTEFRGMETFVFSFMFMHVCRRQEVYSCCLLCL